MEQFLQLAAGETKLYLESDANLRITQKQEGQNGIVEVSYSRPTDICGNILFASLTRFYFEKQGSYPLPDQFSSNISNASIQCPVTLKNIIETPLPNTLPQDPNIILGESHLNLLLLQTQGAYGETTLYSRNAERFEVLGRRKSGIQRFAIKMPGQDDPTEIETELKSLISIGNQEVLQVMKVLYGFHNSDANDSDYNTNTLDALLIYAQKILKK